MTLIQRPGEPPRDPSNPIEIVINPLDRAVAVKHENGSQVAFRHDGTVGIRDAHGTFFQTLPDGTFEISAKAIRFITDTPPSVHLRQPKKEETGG